MVLSARDVFEEDQPEEYVLVLRGSVWPRSLSAVAESLASKPRSNPASLPKSWLVTRQFGRYPKRPWEEINGDLPDRTYGP